MDSITPFLMDAYHLAKQAVACEAAKLFGVAAQWEAYCGDCWKCAAVRLALMALLGWSAYAVLGGFICALVVTIYLATATVTGRGAYTGTGQFVASVVRMLWNKATGKA